MEKYKINGGLLKSHYIYEQNINVFFTGIEYQIYREINKYIYDNLERVKIDF